MVTRRSLSVSPVSHCLCSGSSPGVVSPHSRRSERRLESCQVSAANHSGQETVCIGRIASLDTIGSSSNPIQLGP